MKKNIGIIILLALLFPPAARSQDNRPLTKDDIEGRWTEYKRIEGDVERQIGEYADTYIFRENMVFHKGEASEGIILFNIAGRYTIEGDSIVISYRDYIEKNASKQEAKKLILKVLSRSGDEMLVQVADYDYEYKMILKK